ncbi:chromate efflux transporter [Lichenicoccus sp.]|uniref:chromate efflux transporter n=1 Tax=Lichenicoccus sp. TaxID=2781899 RepID=UPI003D0D7CE3
MAGRPGTPFEVLLAFLRLGLTSFGGPVAHLGYFRSELVERRGWVSEQDYAEIVGLCQFLPGPASSQAGFALGLLRAGPIGALAAWAGFTLPSALFMLLCADLAGGLAASPLGHGLLHGLRLAAVAVVAGAVLGMARSLCPDRPRAAIAMAAMLATAAAPAGVAQMVAIFLGAAAGLLLCRGTGAPRDAIPIVQPVSAPAGARCLGLFLALLVLPPVLAAQRPEAVPQGLRLFEAFSRAGALVFGGGHVVLPLLHDAVVAPGWVPEDRFLAGYGLVQAVPGPLFSFAAYLGAVAWPGSGGLQGATIALLAIFLPGLLLVAGTLPFWNWLRARPAARAAVQGANAAVVGLLAMALYDPLWTSTILRPADFIVAVAGFLLLTMWQVPPLAVVALGAASGAALSLHTG